MKHKKISFSSLSDYIDYLQSRGKYVFTQNDAKEAVGCSEWAVRIAANRLIAKERIIKLRYAFYLIIPLEHKVAGAPPPFWYIDSLMQHHKQPYYVALLSAAALYGAAHQQPQVFQVMTNKSLRSITIGRAHIQFLVKKNIEQCDVQKKQTETGYVNVSTPEVTALDLVQYADRAGSLNHVTTVLIELSEAIDENKLVEAAKNEKLVVAQRLGYLLETYGEKKVTHSLKYWLSQQKTAFIPLRTDKDYQKISKNKDWRIFINEKIEIDDL
jgi:predicted transcriptional regulator of viral defense system